MSLFPVLPGISALTHIGCHLDLPEPCFPDCASMIRKYHGMLCSKRQAR